MLLIIFLITLLAPVLLAMCYIICPKISTSWGKLAPTGRHGRHVFATLGRGGHWTWGTGYRGALAKRVRFMFPNQFFRLRYEFLWVNLCEFDQFCWAQKSFVSQCLLSNAAIMQNLCSLEIQIDTHKPITYSLECRICICI